MLRDGPLHQLTEVLLVLTQGLPRVLTSPVPLSGFVFLAENKDLEILSLGIELLCVHHYLRVSFFFLFLIIITII